MPVAAWGAVVLPSPSPFSLSTGGGDRCESSTSPLVGVGAHAASGVWRRWNQTMSMCAEGMEERRRRSPVTVAVSSGRQWGAMSGQPVRAFGAGTDGSAVHALTMCVVHNRLNIMYFDVKF